MKYSIKIFIQKLWSIPLVRNVVHTFWQAFLATALVGVPAVLAVVHKGDVDAGERATLGLLVAAVAAGFSAVKTTVSAAYQVRKQA